MHAQEFVFDEANVSGFHWKEDSVLMSQIE